MGYLAYSLFYHDLSIINLLWLGNSNTSRWCYLPDCWTLHLFPVPGSHGVLYQVIGTSGERKLKRRECDWANTIISIVVSLAHDSSFISLIYPQLILNCLWINLLEYLSNFKNPRFSLAGWCHKLRVATNFRYSNNDFVLACGMLWNWLYNCLMKEKIY